MKTPLFNDFLQLLANIADMFSPFIISRYLERSNSLLLSIKLLKVLGYSIIPFSLIVKQCFLSSLKNNRSKIPPDL